MCFIIIYFSSVIESQDLSNLSCWVTWSTIKMNFETLRWMGQKLIMTFCIIIIGSTCTCTLIIDEILLLLLLWWVSERERERVSERKRDSLSGTMQLALRMRRVSSAAHARESERSQKARSLAVVPLFSCFDRIPRLVFSRSRRTSIHMQLWPIELPITHSSSRPRMSTSVPSALE